MESDLENLSKISQEQSSAPADQLQIDPRLNDFIAQLGEIASIKDHKEKKRRKDAILSEVQHEGADIGKVQLHLSELRKQRAEHYRWLLMIRSMNGSISKEVHDVADGLLKRIERTLM